MSDILDLLCMHSNPVWVPNSLFWAMEQKGKNMAQKEDSHEKTGHVETSLKESYLQLHFQQPFWSFKVSVHILYNQFSDNFLHLQICFFFSSHFCTSHPCSLTYAYLFHSSILNNSYKTTVNKICNILLSLGILPSKA